ncbi:MAG: helix-turn-helix transcriptional regulator [Myxococcales bacterium]|nr:helix-turn-helix transcriptional regulator [Myxococcales bacterium]
MVYAPTDGDDAQRGAAGLALIRRIYLEADAERFPRGSLELIAEALQAEAGLSAFRPVGAARATPTAAWGTPSTKASVVRGAIEAALDLDDGAHGADDVTARAAGLLAASVGGPAQPFLVLRATHREMGTSIWIIGREVAFDGADRALAAAVAPNLGYAGELALKRAPSLLPGTEDAFAGAVPPRPVVGDEPAAKRVDGLFPVQRARRATPPARRQRLDGLPPRPADCARLAARGYTNMQIAEYLGVPLGTVARDLNRVYRHLGIRGRHELDVQALLTDPKPPRGGR